MTWKSTCACLLLTLLSACTKNPTAPGQTTTSLLPFTLNGRVVAAASSSAISDATVTIADGPDAGKSAITSNTGTYNFSGLQQAAFTVNVSAPNFVTGSSRVLTTSGAFVVTTLRLTGLSVHILDSLFRSVSGAAVQLLDGPQAGLSAVTDTSGDAGFSGSFAEPVTLSINKDGFNNVVAAAPLQGSGLGMGVIYVHLKAPDLVQLTPGRYAITIASDGNCSNIPAYIQTRTYSASVVAFTGPQAGDGYIIALDSPRTTFNLYVSGRDVRVDVGDDLPFADLPNGLTIWGSATGTVTTSPGSVLSLPFSYYFSYNYATCTGENGLFTLASQ
jgi:hypothetical protein